MKSWDVFKRFSKKQLKLEKEEHAEETYDEIKAGAYFSGFNLWILGFAMLIACIGLNTDNLSALIGAMLISPLMGPIVGFAFGLSINDRWLKNSSIRNWLWMTLISLIASTFYFLITPFGHDTNALFLFTKASIFDILLAFFGGLAGFLGIIKKEGTKVIAGVAVATACMPPLCTIGYGIAHLNITFIFGGFYFYLVNCLFIGLATFLLSRFLKYQLSMAQHQGLKKNSKLLWSFFIVLMILPGIYIAYKKYKTEYLNPTIVITDKERIDLLEKKVADLDSILKVRNYK